MERGSEVSWKSFLSLGQKKRLLLAHITSSLSYCTSIYSGSQQLSLRYWLQLFMTATDWITTTRVIWADFGQVSRSMEVSRMTDLVTDASGSTETRQPAAPVCHWTQKIQSAEAAGELVQWHQRLLQRPAVRVSAKPVRWIGHETDVGGDVFRGNLAPGRLQSMSPGPGDCGTGVRLSRVRINARLDSKRGNGEIAAILSPPGQKKVSFLFSLFSRGRLVKIGSHACCSNKRAMALYTCVDKDYEK